MTTTTVLSFILLVLVGFVVGIFSGMLGIGGGTVIVPVLRLCFGFEAVCATATSLFTIIFTSISGTAAHIRNKTCFPKLGVCLGLAGAVTSSLGVYLGSISPSWLIMLVAAAIILYSGYSMLKKALKLSGAPSEPSRSPRRTEACSARSAQSDGNEGNEPYPDYYPLNAKRILGGIGIGLIAGLASGYVGVGGGFIMVPLMTAWLGVPVKRASGTSLIAIMILAIPSTIENIIFGNVQFAAGIALVIGSIPGAVVGAKLLTRIPERTFRFIFAGFLAVAAVMLLVKEFVL